MKINHEPKPKQSFGSRFNVHNRVMEHGGSLESTKEASSYPTVELCIKSDAKNGRQYQKWLFALSETLSKLAIGFISNFLLKARVLTVLKRKNLSLPLKVETDQTVFHLFGFTRVSDLSKFVTPSDKEANRDGADAESPFLLFFPFLPHLRTLAQKKRWENCLRFGTGGLGFCLYPLLSRNVVFLPRANNGHSRK